VVVVLSNGSFARWRIVSVCVSVELELDLMGEGLTGVFLTADFVTSDVAVGFDAADTGLLMVLVELTPDSFAGVVAVVLLIGAFLTGVAEAGFCVDVVVDNGFDCVVDCIGFLAAGDIFVGGDLTAPAVVGFLTGGFEGVVPSFLGPELAEGLFAPWATLFTPAV
jgi:hypothetical protein